VPTSKVPPRASGHRVLVLLLSGALAHHRLVVEKSSGKQRLSQVSRPVLLDTGGVDGRQARLRRESDRLKACHAHSDPLLSEEVSFIIRAASTLRNLG
jgi:hypothetical protein